MDDRQLPRIATTLVEKALKVSPVVVVMGARQTGKTTLVRHLADSHDRRYLTLDDLTVRGDAIRDPDALVRSAPRLVLDEVQRHPDLLLAIKRAVDERRPREPGRFLLTGSANLLLMRRVSETLAGRASYVLLWPLTRGELRGLAGAALWDALFETPVAGWYDLVRASTALREDWRTAARSGGYPVPAHELRTHDERSLWFSGFVQTYLERDLQDLSAIDNLVDFQRLMQVACHRLGNLANQAELGRDAGIPRPTVHRYLNLLETSFQLLRIVPYAVNRTKRLIKTPKIYWSDTGLASFLAGLDELPGSYLENLVLLDLIAWRDAQATRPVVVYWRTAADQEVDLVIEHRRGLVPIEIKATSRPSSSDVRHLRAFCDEYRDRVRGGLLLHDGDEVFWAGPRILAAPWWRMV